MWGTLSRIRSIFRRPSQLEIWHDEAYRMPLPSMESTGVELRRVDFVAWFLLDRKAIRPAQLRVPSPISYENLLRVHTPTWIEDLHRPETLAGVFSVDPSEVAVDPVLRSIRLGCGATLEAARTALVRKGPTLNLHGGFHHARRAGGGGFCAVNDIAVAVATLRAEGFDGQVCVLDLDAHPPDGIADCLGDDPKTWIGSLSGSHWGALPGVEEVLLPEGADNARYLEALDSLLERMPKPNLAFVIAGCDVLAGDRFGRLALTLGGVRQRDVHVMEKLEGVPTVWLPGGGYHRDAWKVLAGTALVLAGQPRRRVPTNYDPLTSRFAHISGQLGPAELQGEVELSFADLEEELSGRPPSSPRLLGFYTKAGLEYALFRMGVLGQLRRLGYDRFRIDFDDTDTGQRARMFGTAEGVEYLLMEAVLERRQIGHEDMLFVNWLSLRNPRATFSDKRPQLPGQEVPGLGLGREVTTLLGLMAKRLGLSAVVFRPAWYHLAFTGRERFHFLDPLRQGRFEALVRDTIRLRLIDVTHALAEGRVRMNGIAYRWEPSDMVFRMNQEAEPDPWRALADEERERVHFTIEPQER